MLKKGSTTVISALSSWKFTGCQEQYMVHTRSSGSVCVYVYFVINEKDIGLVRRTHITLHFTHLYINIYFIHSHTPHHKDLSTVEMQVQLDPKEQTSAIFDH